MGDCVSWCNPVFKQVDKLPSVISATRNHTYITPDGNKYILNAVGDGFEPLFEGKIVDIVSKDNTIIVAKEEGDKVTTFNLSVSKEVLDRITNLENKEDRNTNYTVGDGLILEGTTIRLNRDSLTPDKYVKDVAVSKEGHKVTLTYTYTDDTVKSVEFDSDDTVALAYDDTDLKQRISALEAKENRDITYTASNGVRIDGTNIVAEVDDITITVDNGKLVAPDRIYLKEIEHKINNVCDIVPEFFEGKGIYLFEYNLITHKPDESSIFSYFSTPLIGVLSVMDNKMKMVVYTEEEDTKVVYVSTSNIGVNDLDNICEASWTPWTRTEENFPVTFLYANKYANIHVDENNVLSYMGKRVQLPTYNDSELKARVEALENKENKNTELDSDIIVKYDIHYSTNSSVTTLGGQTIDRGVLLYNKVTKIGIINLKLTTKYSLDGSLTIGHLEDNAPKPIEDNYYTLHNLSKLDGSRGWLKLGSDGSLNASELEENNEYSATIVGYFE